jgi:hypothetical protein
MRVDKKKFHSSYQKPKYNYSTNLLCRNVLYLLLFLAQAGALLGT